MFSQKRFWIGTIGLMLLIVTRNVLPQETPNHLAFLKQASTPSRFFNLPTASVMRSMEITISGGGLVSVESDKTLLQKFNIGLGGIAEVEFSTSGIRNRLTKKSEQMPTSTFKVALIPERFRHYWFIPDVTVQLRSSSWNVLEGGNDRLVAAVMDSYNGRNLLSIDNLQKRFSMLYLIVGKNFEYGGIHLGVSQTDVRTRQGRRFFYDANKDAYLSERIPEMDTQFVTPFGGVELVANDATRLIAEIQVIPAFDYDPRLEKLEVRQIWLGIAGIRFFLAQWFSLDTGVRYQDDYRGIADAEIDIGVNCVLPFNALKRR